MMKVNLNVYKLIPTIMTGDLQSHISVGLVNLKVALEVEYSRDTHTVRNCSKFSLEIFEIKY